MEPPPPRLDGWKAIAAYLGRDERTAQRWRERGLPVHAVPGGRRGTVFAYTADIDEWLKQRPADDAGDSSAVSANSETSAAPPVFETSATQEDAPTAGSAPPKRPAAGVSWMLPAAGAALALLGTIVLVGTAGGWRLTSPRQVGRAELTAAGLVVADPLGQALFAVPVSSLQPPGASPTELNLDGKATRPIVADLDGDGEREVLVVLWQDQLRHGEVRSYSAAGDLRWQYSLERRLQFGDKVFDGPWRVTDRLVVPTAGGRARLWLAIIHDVWWPSFVVSIDAAGRERLHLTHSGHLYALHAVETPDGPSVLATGVNNEHQGAVLAAMRPDDIPAVSPQRDEAYVCASCPVTPVWRYLLFPRSELSMEARRAYNLGIELRQVREGVRVTAEEVPAPDRLLNHYVLTRDLAPSSAQIPDAYWSAHQHLESAGVLHHQAQACAERRTRLVRTWQGDRWQDVEVPVETFAR